MSNRRMAVWYVGIWALIFVVCAAIGAHLGQ